MKNCLKMSCLPVLAALAVAALSTGAGFAATSPGAAAQEVSPIKAKPEVRAAGAKLRAALDALEAVMLRKDGFISPAFKRFEVGELKAPAEASPVLTAPELKRLHAAFSAVQGTPELYAYVKAKRAYLEAMRQAQAAS
jgi:hypothetical protein